MGSPTRELALKAAGLCAARNRHFLCTLERDHHGDHMDIAPNAVCGIAWPNEGAPVSEHNSSDIILQARGAAYGDFAEQAAFAQSMKDCMGRAPNWHDLKPFQRESLEMIATKISRILHGDPEHVDSWVDVAGYANLGAGWKP